MAPGRTPTEEAAVKQLGEGWNWRDLAIGNRFKTFGRTLFEADLLNFVTLCGFSEELFTNKEYIAHHAPMRGGHPVPGALVFSMAEGLVIPTTLQGSGLAFLSMGFDIKGPTYVGDTIHVEIEVSEIRPTSKDPSRALVRTTNVVKNQKDETVLVYTPLRMMQGR
jgi:acyl dehydratase